MFKKIPLTTFIYYNYTATDKDAIFNITYMKYPNYKTSKSH